MSPPFWRNGEKNGLLGQFSVGRVSGCESTGWPGGRRPFLQNPLTARDIKTGKEMPLSGVEIVLHADAGTPNRTDYKLVSIFQESRIDRLHSALRLPRNRSNASEVNAQTVSLLFAGQINNRSIAALTCGTMPRVTVWPFKNRGLRLRVSLHHLFCRSQEMAYSWNNAWKQS